MSTLLILKNVTSLTLLTDSARERLERTSGFCILFQVNVLEIRREHREEVGGTGHQSATAAVLTVKGYRVRGLRSGLGSQRITVSAEEPFSREYVHVSAGAKYTSSKILWD